MFLYCGGHHDSDRTAVLVWSPRLKLLYCKYHQFMYTLPNKDFLPSFLPSFHAVLLSTGSFVVVTLAVLMLSFFLQVALWWSLWQYSCCPSVCRQLCGGHSSSTYAVLLSTGSFVVVTLAVLMLSFCLQVALWWSL